MGSLPATPDLADEMNRVESAVDFIAGQEHDDSEKTEILDIAAKAISSSGELACTARVETFKRVARCLDIHVD